MRVLDEEATLDEREELLALADADERLSEQFELRFALRETLQELAGSPETIEVVGAVLMALSIEDEWDLVADGLRDILSEATPSPALADAVMAEVIPAEYLAQLALSALFDGELSADERKAFANRAGPVEMSALQAHAALSGLIHDAIEERARCVEPLPIWEAVAPAIGLANPHEIPGWEPVGAAIREAVLARAERSPAQVSALTAQIMDDLLQSIVEVDPVESELEPAVAELDRGWQRWVSALFGPVAVLAMALLLFMPNAFQNDGSEAPTEPPGPPLAELVQPDSEDIDSLILAADNHAEVESLEYADDVIVQLIQQEDAPLFVWIEELDEGATL